MSIRELTEVEMSLIAGGVDPPPPEIVVTAHGGYQPNYGYVVRYNTYSWEYSFPYGSSGPYNDWPTDPTLTPAMNGYLNHEHENIQQLSPSANIDLTDCNTSWVQIGNHMVSVIIDNKTAPPNSDAAVKGIQAAQGIAYAWQYLNDDAKLALDHIQNIVITDTVRSFSQEDRHTFYLDTSEVTSESWAYATSQILHDANHMMRYDAYNDFNYSRGRQAEIDGISLQIANATMLSLSTSEVAYLQNLLDHPELLDARVNTPVY